MRAKKSFGQHFLVNRGILDKIATAVPEYSLIIEIGPGTGALTEKLVDRFGEDRLILIEADRDLIGDLEEKYPNVKTEFADAAKVNFDDLTKNQDWVLVGNLPYNASAAILENAMKATNKPSACIIMVQKEQAQRMIAGPGNMSLLSIATQLYFDVKKLFDVSPGSFNPPPKVQSSVMRLNLRKDYYKRAEEVIDLAKKGFVARRKKLVKNLVATDIWARRDVEDALKTLGLSPTIRAQELSIENWCELFELLKTK